MKSVELTAGSADVAASSLADRVIAPVARRRLVALLAAVKVGRLTVHLPDGSVVEAGEAESDLHATMWIARDAFFRKFALGGDLGAGESYMDGDWRTDDLCRFVELVLRNQAHLPLDSWLSRLINLPNDWLHVRRRNSRRGSRRNIGAHYDLSNELFATFLDPSLAYSSAVFHGGDESLADDPLLATNRDRCANGGYLESQVNDRLAARSVAEWLVILEQAHVPAAAINDMSHVLADPQLAARGMWHPLEIGRASCRERVFVGV